MVGTGSVVRADHRRLFSSTRLDAVCWPSMAYWNAVVAWIAWAFAVSKVSELVGDK